MTLGEGREGITLPGESQGQGSLVGCRLWGHTESDMIEVTQQRQQQQRRDHNLLLVGLTLGRTYSSGGEHWDWLTDQLCPYQNWTNNGKEKVYLKRVPIFSLPLQTLVRVHLLLVPYWLNPFIRTPAGFTFYHLNPKSGNCRHCNMVPSFTQPSLTLLQWLKVSNNK